MKDLLLRYPQLSVCENDIENALDLLIKAFKNGGKLLVCGNGGSSADAEHIVGELVKGFKCKRKVCDHRISPHLCEKLQGGLPAFSLSSQNALITAISNDTDADMIFAQQVFAYAKPNDLVMGITTSGNSKNVVNALRLAREMGVDTLALTGADGGAVKEIANVTICVSENETYKIQELHLPVYHYLCASVEKEFFE